MVKARTVALLAVAAVACGTTSPSPAKPEVPMRTATSGDALLAVLPAGAQVVVEVDGARLRANGTLGPVLTALAGLPAEKLEALVKEGGRFAAVAIAVLDDADTAVIASYGISRGKAETVVLVRGGSRAFPDAVTLDDGTRVVGSDSWLARVRAVARGEAPSLSSSKKFLAVRAAAMPEKSTGAWLRVTALLDFEARVTLASRFGLNIVPVSLSLWSDVADDVALVTLLGGEKPGEARVLARTLGRRLLFIARSPAVRLLGLGRAIETMRVDAEDRLVRGILLIGPRQLARTATRAMTLLRGRGRESGPAQ